MLQKRKTKHSKEAVKFSKPKPVLAKVALFGLANFWNDVTVALAWGYLNYNGGVLWGKAPRVDRRCVIPRPLLVWRFGARMKSIPPRGGFYWKFGGSKNQDHNGCLFFWFLLVADSICMLLDLPFFCLKG